MWQSCVEIEDYSVTYIYLDRIQGPPTRERSSGLKAA